MQFAWLILAVSLFQGGQTSVCNTYISITDNASGPYKYGDTVHFSCEVCNQTRIDSSKFFLWNIKSHTKIPISDIRGHTGYTDVKVISKETGGTYSCHYDDCTEDTLRSVTVLKLDECSIPHQEDSKTPYLNCIVNDLNNMTCDWSIHGNGNCITWRAMYKTEEMEAYQCCAANESGNCSSTKTQCYIPDSDFYRFTSYNISLTGISEQGTHVYHYTVVPDDSIVRIDMDNVVHVNKGGDPYTLVLGFSLHHSPNAVGVMNCNVSYVSEWDNGDNAVTSVHNMTQSTLDVTITLDRLTPFTNYTVDIACKPQASQYWSNVATGFGRTRSAVCNSVPDIIGYSDTKTDMDGQRKLFLYLKPLLRREWYGLHTVYIVRVVFEDKRDSQVFPADTVTGEFTGTFTTNQSYAITIHTVNEAGVTDLSVGINISTSDEEDQSLVTVVVEEADEKSHVILFPECADDITSVTYYFCLAETKIYPPVCKTEIQNVTVLGFNKTISLVVNSTYKEKYIWHYGVEINRSDMLTSNRIVWSSCTFSNNVQVSTKHLDVSASVLPSNNSVITVHLDFEYCQLSQRPLSYHVGVWETHRNYSDYCKINVAELLNFSATPSTKQLQVFRRSVLDVSLCLRIQYREQFYILPDFYLISNRKASKAAKKMEKGTTIVIAVICSGTFCLLLVFLMFSARKRFMVMVNRNEVPDEIIARILQESPENMPTENHIWPNSNDSSGIFTITSGTSSADLCEDKGSDKKGANKTEDNPASSSYLHETSMLESNRPVQTENEHRNTDDYLEPAVNLRNNCSERSGSSCTDYQLVAGQSNTGISSDDRYLVAAGQSNTGIPSDDGYLVATVQSNTGIPSDDRCLIAAGQSNTCIPLDDRYLVAAGQSNTGIPSDDGYLLAAGHRSDEPVDVTLERPDNGNNSYFPNNTNAWFINSENLGNDIHDMVDGLQILRTSDYEGPTSGDTVVSDIQSAEEYQQAGNWSSSDLDSEVMTVTGTETTTLGNSVDEVFKEPAVVSSDINGIQETYTTPYFHTESTEREIEMIEMRLNDSAIQNSIDKGVKHDSKVEVTDGEPFTIEDFRSALGNIGQILENETDMETDTEYSVDSYIMADAEIQSDSVFVDSGANMEGYVRNSSQ